MEAEVIANEEIERETIEVVNQVSSTYEHGFETKINTEFAPKGISEYCKTYLGEK